MTQEETDSVFVDPSGRRGRLVGRVFWLLSCLASAYVVLVLLSLIVPAGLSRLAIPGIGTVVPGTGAPKLPDADGTKQTASLLLAPTSAPKRLPQPRPSTTGRRTIPTSTALPRPTPAAASPSPRRTGPPTPRPTAVPASATSHPTPRSTKAASPKPHPTRTPRR